MISLKKDTGCFMNDGKKIANELLNNIVGMKPTRVKLGNGSFLTIDFGKDIPSLIKSRSGSRTVYFGEWYLWIYMCAWRIDKDELPLVGSNDNREKIQAHLFELENRVLTQIVVSNNSFDLKIKFGENVSLNLFSFNTTDHQQWMFYTQDNKVFTAGPASNWSYENSDA